jgi:hypothetical protein
MEQIGVGRQEGEQGVMMTIRSCGKRPDTHGKPQLSVRRCAVFLSLSSFGLLLAQAPTGKQVIQRGAFGKPAQVLDETDQWTTSLPLAADRDVQIYIPDVTSDDWLKRNYDEYQSRGTYTLSMFTWYRTPEACRTNQINWGLGDAAHLNACNLDIGYRVRRAVVDPQQKTVTLIMAAMIDKNGVLDPTSVQDKGAFRSWDQLDSNTLSALRKANALVAQQMKVYDDRLHKPR